MQSLSAHTAAVPCGFWLHWLTSQARYVRVLIPRRAMRASCESPWRVSAKPRISGACFPLTTPFRTCFSPCEVARTADVQTLIGMPVHPKELLHSYLPLSRHRASLSQALRLGDLPPPHRTFQGHATHIIEWSMMLRPNDSWSTCIPQGIATFLHYASRRGAGSRYTTHRRAIGAVRLSHLCFLVIAQLKGM